MACLGCGNTVGAVLKCKACQVAVYCSTDCQKSHWKSRHSAECCIEVKQKIYSASFNGREKELAQLLERNPSIKLNWRNPQSILGGTAVFVAAQQGHAGCLALLWKRGADITARIDCGYAPVHIACRLGHPECLRVLIPAMLSLGIDLGLPSTIKDDDGVKETPAHICILFGQLECLDLFYSHGVSPNDLNRHGQNHVHLAAMHCSEKVIQLAYQRGGDINLIDNQQHTPLDMAVLMAHLSSPARVSAARTCVLLLRRLGAKETPDNDPDKTMIFGSNGSFGQDVLDLNDNIAKNAKKIQRKVRRCAYPLCELSHLYKCGGCRVTFYCSKAHAILHRSAHENFCRDMCRVCDDMECERRARVKCETCSAWYCNNHTMTHIHG